MICSALTAAAGVSCAADTESIKPIPTETAFEETVLPEDMQPVSLPKGYHALSDTEQRAYDSIAAAFGEFEDHVYFTEELLPGELKRAYELMYTGDSRFFYIDGHYDYFTDGSGYVSKMRLRYSVPPEYAEKMQERLETAADSILSGITPDMSGYDTAAYIHDCTAALCEYKENSFQGDTAYGAIIRGEGICRGYAKGFAYLCGRAGIPAGVVDGFAEGEAHMWNVFELDGELFYADVTRDDGGGKISRRYFGLTAEEMSGLGYMEK